MTQVKSRLGWLLLALLAYGRVSSAQQNPTTMRQNPASATTRQNTFELEKQNAERVAASADQIRVVLIQDPGLLVELKQLVAKEAKIGRAHV